MGETSFSIQFAPVFMLKMQLPLLGGIVMLTAAVAMVISPAKQPVSESQSAESQAESRPIRQDRPVGFERRSEPAFTGRRPLGMASLATLGRPSAGVVTVGGQVRQPGSHGYSDGLTVRQVIKNAGGATEFGSIKRVKLIRKGKMYQVDLSNDEVKPLIVQPNDTIEVPQKMFFGR